MTIENQPSTGKNSFYKDPRQARPGESIGGGFFVVRRGERTNRIRFPKHPFEHPSREAAQSEAIRLAGNCAKGCSYDVLEVVGSYKRQKYDFGAMDYDPTKSQFIDQFIFDQTPQGYWFWWKYFEQGDKCDHAQEAGAALKEMRAQWEAEQKAQADV